MTCSHAARISACGLIFALVGACSPTIQSFTVDDGEPGESLAAATSLDANATTIHDVTVATGVAGSGSYGAAQSMSGTGGGAYSGATLAHGPGDYEALLSVRYRRLMLPGLQTLTRTLPFSLVWPEGTFDFGSSAAGVDGWTFQGVFLTNGDNVPCDPELLSILFSRSGAGWPGGIGNTSPGFPNGSLRVLLSDNCFPASTDPSAPLWQFNLVSPDLEGRPEWQGIDGVSFRMIVSGMPVQVMATVVHEAEDGSDAYASPMAGGSLDFAEVSSSWETVTRTGYVPEGRTVRRLLIRVFGEQGPLASFGEPGTLLLDVVQPVS